MLRKFNVINLEINHRQGKEKDNADMLKRVREGNQTKDDVNKMKERSKSLYCMHKKQLCED